MKRYFIVYFVVVINETMEKINTVGTYVDINNKYVNQAKFKNQTMAHCEKANIQVLEITITGVDEVNEEDFMTFIEGTNTNGQTLY